MGGINLSACLRTHTHTRTLTQKANAHTAVPGTVVYIDEVLTGATAMTFTG